MAKVSKILTKISTSKFGQNIYKTLSEPNKEYFLNNTLPLISGGVCTGSYIFATAHDKHIPKERKPILQMQNIANGVIGILISAKLNKYASKKGEEVIKYLKTDSIKNFEDIISGVKIGIPILITSLVMRLLVSSGSVLVSDWYKRIDNKIHQQLDLRV